MAQDGGEQVTVGLEHILVMSGLAHFSDHFTFDRDQLKDVAATLVAAEGQIPPGIQGGVTGAWREVSRISLRESVRKPFSATGNPIASATSPKRNGIQLSVVIQRLFEPSWRTSAKPGS